MPGTRPSACNSALPPRRERALTRIFYPWHLTVPTDVPSGRDGADRGTVTHGEPTGAGRDAAVFKRPQAAPPLVVPQPAVILHCRQVANTPTRPPDSS